MSIFDFLCKECMNISYNWRESEWERYKKRKRDKLKNTDFTIIAANCCGTIMYYDLKLPFLSPTINLTIGMNDFVKMLENLPWYMDQEIVELKGDYKFPVGVIGDVKINFVHYDTFENAALKWKERKGRINWDNLFIVGIGGCNYETIKQFDKLSYKNKVIFTHTNYPEITSSYYIRGFEEQEYPGTLTDFKKQFLKRRYLDDFDYVNFLNG